MMNCTTNTYTTSSSTLLRKRPSESERDDAPPPCKRARISADDDAYDARANKENIAPAYSAIAPSTPRTERVHAGAYTPPPPPRRTKLHRRASATGHGLSTPNVKKLHRVSSFSGIDIDIDASSWLSSPAPSSPARPASESP